MSGKSLALLMIGLPILAFGIVWTLVISPRLEKMPTDYSREDVFEGTYTFADPFAGQQETIPVTALRVRKATKTEGNRLFITETVNYTSLTGVPVPQLPPNTTELIVDRVNRHYLPGDAKNRAGAFTFPTNLKKEETYLLWIGLAERPLEATYRKTEKIRGLDLFEFQIAERDLIISPDPASGLQRRLDTFVRVKAEPRTGIMVDTINYTIISTMHPERGKQQVFTSDIGLTEENVTLHLKEAKSERRHLIWFGFYLPRGLIGLGVMVAVPGIVFALQARNRGASR